MADRSDAGESPKESPAQHPRPGVAAQPSGGTTANKSSNQLSAPGASKAKKAPAKPNGGTTANKSSNQPSAPGASKAKKAPAKPNGGTTKATKATKATKKPPDRRPARGAPAKQRTSRPGPAPARPQPARIPATPGWLTPVVLVAITAFIFWQLKPGALFSASLPTGGDLGGHVASPAEFRDLLPRLTGWTSNYFGGYPAYQFYMPIPALGVLAFNLILPYGFAFKLLVALIVLGLPVASWALGRLSRLPGPVPVVMAIAVLPFLFDDSNFKYGGNLLSTVAGEFSYGLGVILVLVALGLLDVALRTGRWRALTAFLAALASLCEPTMAVMMIVGGALLFGVHCLHGVKLALRRAAPIVVLAPLMALFWFLPFAWNRSERDPLPYPLTGGWLHLLFPLPVWVTVILFALAIVGGVQAVQRRHPVSLMLVGIALFAALAVLLFPRGWFGGWEFQQALSWTGSRILPFWYLTMGLLAGIGGGELVLRVAIRWSPATTVVPIAALAVTLVCTAVAMGAFGTNTVVTTSQVPHTVEQAFSGYQGDPLWPQYKALIDTMARVGATHGCGRALPEYDPTFMYGSPFETTLLPYWTNGCIQSMYGIPIDASLNYTFEDLASAAVSPSNYDTVQPGVTYPTTPFFHAVTLMRDLGVRYYLAFNSPAIDLANKEPGLVRVATSGPWVVYLVQGSALVEGLTHEPVVAFPSPSVDALTWIDTASHWYLGNVTARPSAGGPPGWPRTDDLATAEPGPALPPVKVTDLTVGQSSVSFHVNRTGIPVEIKESYYPWWTARGAEGPWRLAPDYLVVVPTSHTVALTASPGSVENVSWIISILAVVATIGLAVWDHRHREARRRVRPTQQGG